MTTPMTLERYAEMRAEMEAGSLRDDVLAGSGTTLDAWTGVQREWLERMSEELERGRFELTNRYTRAFLARQSTLQKTSAPVPARASEAPLSPLDTAHADTPPDEGRETMPMPMPMSMVHRQPFPVAAPPRAPAAMTATTVFTAPMLAHFAGDDVTALPIQSPLRAPLPFRPGAPGGSLPVPPAPRPPLPSDPADQTLLPRSAPTGPVLPFEPRGAPPRAPAAPAPPAPPAPPNAIDVTLMDLSAHMPQKLPFRSGAPNPPSPGAPPRGRGGPGPDLRATRMALFQPIAPSLPFQPTAAPSRNDSDPDEERTARVSGDSRQAMLPRPAGATAGHSPSPPGAARGPASESLTLEQHASLHAELDHAPSRAVETLRRYGVTRDELSALDARWKQRFADPALHARWQDVYRVYLGVLGPRR